VRKVLRRLGWKETLIAQPDLPLQIDQGASPSLSAIAGSASPSPPPRTLDTDPADRRGDRFLARLGLLDDAAPLPHPLVLAAPRSLGRMGNNSHPPHVQFDVNRAPPRRMLPRRSPEHLPVEIFVAVKAQQELSVMAAVSQMLVTR